MRTLFILQFITFLFINNACALATDSDALGPFKILPWQVGQYAVYQIVSIESDSLDNRYKFSLMGKEEIGDKTYFWMEIEISEGRYKKRNAIIRTLVPTLTSEEFKEKAAELIANGLFPLRAKRITVQLEGGAFYEQNLASIMSSQGVVRDSDYKLTPDSMGRINFTKLRVDNNPSDILVNSKRLRAFHLYVETDPSEKFNAEGIDFWRSPEVPFLGLVRMEFSKTLYWEKYKRKHASEGFLEHIFTSIVPGREKADIYIANLIDYGAEEKK